MRKPLLVFSGLFLAGCATIQSLSQHGVLVLKPEISAGEYTTKTAISTYSQADIDHLVLKLFTYDGQEHDLGIEKSIPNAQLANSITFSNLRVNTTYRIKAYAYAANSALISLDASPSYTDVSISSDDRPNVATLKVQLIDKLFNGQGTSSLAITNGGYSYSASESLKVPMLGVVTTYAGSLTSGVADGFRTAATFINPRGIVFSPSGYLYAADDGARNIRRIDPNGYVTTFAGSGNPGFVNGQGTAASFSHIFALAVDAAGNLYVTDYTNNAIRKIDTSANVTTLAGNGTAGSADGSGMNATFNSPLGICVDSSGNVFVADSGSAKIRKITPTGVVTTLAGNGSSGATDGPGSVAKFSASHGLAIDSQNNIYVADIGSNRIRKVTPSGVVSTVAGNGAVGAADGLGTQATLNAPVGITVDSSDNIYFSDRGGNLIRKLSSAGVVTTIAGNGTVGTTDGTGNQATFNNPEGLAFDAFGNLYVVSYDGHRIRQIH